jgi:hypothetical protein
MNIFSNRWGSLLPMQGLKHSSIRYSRPSTSNLEFHTHKSNSEKMEFKNSKYSSRQRKATNSDTSVVHEYHMEENKIRRDPWIKSMFVLYPSDLRSAEETRDGRLHGEDQFRLPSTVRGVQQLPVVGLRQPWECCEEGDRKYVLVGHQYKPTIFMNIKLTFPLHIDFVLIIFYLCIFNCTNKFFLQEYIMIFHLWPLYGYY